MARSIRGVVGGGYYHVLNRGNGRQRIFHKESDYEAFERVLGEALGRYAGVTLLAYCLMPNHWHLILHPRGDRDLPAFMQWMMVTHVRRHHQAHSSRGGGHLYQGRYKSFPIQDDHHFLVVCRYVESNAFRARLMRLGGNWRFCSLHTRGMDKPLVKLSDWPVDRPRQWDKLVNAALPKRQLQSLRVSVNRGRPFGEESWVRRTAKRLGLTQSLNPAGRPKKTARANGKNQ